MVEDIYETVRQCEICARNRIAEKRRTNPLKIFPPGGSLESVAMDKLGPLPRTKHGNLFLLVIADRFSKVTKTVPLRTITALSVARAFWDHWAYIYGPPASLFTDNGPQFTDKFFQTACAELGIKKVFTTAYHPQTNGQVEQYNRTILASLRGYVAVLQDDWDDYTSAVTFAYNCRVHSSLGMAPLELALTRPPRSLSLQQNPRADERTPSTIKLEFLESLKTLRLRAGENLHQAQTRYKRRTDRGVVQKNGNLQEGDEAYLRLEVTDVGRNHKLESIVQGLYQVVENAGQTLRLRIEEETVRVSSDRVKPAPRRETTRTTNEDNPPFFRLAVGGMASTLPSVSAESPQAITLRAERRLRFTLPDISPGTQSPSSGENQEYVVDRIVDAFGDILGRNLHIPRTLDRLHQ
jgi:hypothetical protein